MVVAGVDVDVDVDCGWESRRNEVSENWDNRKNRNRRGGSCRIDGCSSDGFGDDDDDGSVWEVVMMMMWWMMKRWMKRWRRQRRVTVESRVRIAQRTRWIGPPVGRIRNRPFVCVVLLCFVCSCFLLVCLFTCEVEQRFF